MLVPGGLGFPGYLVIFVVVPVVSFLVIRQKWRNSVERNKEILRLVAMASEEAKRAELQAAAEYGSAAVSFSPFSPFPVGAKNSSQSQCAVCFCPTTTRCSQCKAVHYCSGKCQIIHWRQGHKEECSPPSIISHFNGPGSDFDQSSVLHEEDEVHGSSLEGASPESSYAPKFVKGIDDDKVGPFVDAKGTDMSSETSSLPSLVDFSTNTTRKSLDVSLSEVPVSSLPDRQEECLFGNIADHRPGTTTTSHVNDSKSTTSQPSRLDTAVNDISPPSVLKQTTTSFPVGVADCRATSSPCSDINISHDYKIPMPSTAHSDFWEGTLDSIESPNDNCDDSTPSSFSEEAEGHLSDDAYPIMSGTKMHCPGASLSKKITRDAFTLRSSATLSSKRSASVESMASDSLKPKERHDSLKPKESASSSTSDDKQSCTNGEHSFTKTRSSMADSVDRTPAGSPEILIPLPNASTGVKTSVRKVVHQLKVYKVSKHNSTGLASESAEKGNYKMLFPYELFVKLYHWNKLDLHPCGLTNCGNSCYANAVLQCLAFTRPLTAYLLQGLHSKSCQKREWCFTCEFESLILKAKEGKSPLSPMGILSQLLSIGSHLGHGREEDAHEFLRYAIDTMQSVCLKEAGANPVGPLAEETTLIGLIFGGYLRSKIKCMKCHGKSERHERMMDLTVEIQGNIGTLEEALKQYTATEILEGENKYHCSRCKSYEKAKKKLTILEAPNVLTIALKRFQSGKFGKLNKPVQFPEILNLAPFMSGASDKSPVYRLYAVVVHLDIMNAAFSGHYVCYVSNLQGKWFKIDDSTVKPVELERVLLKGAYMLLYSRCSPRAPTLTRNTILCNESKASKGSQSSEAVCSSSSGKSTMSRERPGNTLLSASPSPSQRRAEDYSHWATLDDPASFEAFDSFDRRFHPLHRIPKVDSSSDNSSLVSNSDEGSCSTESTRDSVDDCSEYIFGDRSWNYPRVTEDCDSSSFPLFRSSHSHLADPDRHTSGFAETSGYPSYRAGIVVEADRTCMQHFRTSSRGEILQAQGNQLFLQSNKNIQCRKLTNSSDNSGSSNSSNSRETDLSLGWCNPFEVKHGVSQRRFTHDRTTHTLY